MESLQVGTVRQANKAYIYLIALVAAAGGFNYGFDIVIMSGAILFMEKEFAMAPSTKGFAMSSAIIGCILGLVIGAWLTDRIGRKKTLFCSAVLFGISA